MKKLLSNLSSPFLIPTFIAILAVFANYYSFGDIKLGYFFIVQMAMYSFVLPSLGLFLMYRLELIPKDDERAVRLLPHFLFLVCYSIGIYAIKQLPISSVTKSVMIGPILATVLSLFTNNFMRLTPNITALGCLIGAFVGITLITTKFILPIALIVIVLTGIIASYQMQKNNHTLREIFYSFFIGFFSQVLSVAVFGLSTIL